MTARADTGNRAALIGVLVLFSAIAVALVVRWRLAEQSAADHAPAAESR